MVGAPHPCRPSYVDGPVRVIGNDVYGLDGNDNDGVGCES
jgi:hypothetical protein